MKRIDSTSSAPPRPTTDKVKRDPPRIQMMPPQGNSTLVLVTFLLPTFLWSSA